MSDYQAMESQEKEIERLKSRLRQAWNVIRLARLVERVHHCCGAYDGCEYSPGQLKNNKKVATEFANALLAWDMCEQDGVK